MGKLKALYQTIMESRTQYENVPAELTMSGEELEEFQFMANLDLINRQLQIDAELDKSENDIA